jgi:hypothetical protein
LTARRGQANLSAMPLMPRSRCSETKFTLHSDLLHKGPDTPIQRLHHGIPGPSLPLPVY